MNRILQDSEAAHYRGRPKEQGENNNIYFYSVSCGARHSRTHCPLYEGVDNLSLCIIFYTHTRVYAYTPLIRIIIIIIIVIIIAAEVFRGGRRFIKNCKIRVSRFFQKEIIRWDCVESDLRLPCFIFVYNTGIHMYTCTYMWTKIRTAQVRL